MSKQYLYTGQRGGAHGQIVSAIPYICCMKCLYDAILRKEPYRLRVVTAAGQVLYGVDPAYLTAVDEVAAGTVVAEPLLTLAELLDDLAEQLAADGWNRNAVACRVQEFLDDCDERGPDALAGIYSDANADPVFAASTAERISTWVQAALSV
jgi:hypothetical protein